MGEGTGAGGGVLIEGIFGTLPKGNRFNQRLG